MVNSGILYLCDREIARWIYERDPVAYHYVADTSTGFIFDVPEYTYILMKIVWSD